MNTSQSKQHLRNKLNRSFDLSDEEYDQLRSEYEFEKTGKNEKFKEARLAKIAGLILLLLGVLFAIQQFFFPFGPDLTRLLRLIPGTGTILVIIIGLGLLSRLRLRRRSRSENKNFGSSDSNDTKPDLKGSGQGAGDAEADKTSAEGSPFDPYAFENRRRWYRSRDEKMIFGVCGGIGERFGIDPTIVRALFALAFFSYGSSLVIYIVLAIVLPRKPLNTVF